MKYPLENYRFYTDNKNTTFAVSTYAGKIVKGWAKLNPKDSYDDSFGQKLAAARCNYKIAKKRMNRAVMRVEEAEKAFNEAKAHLKAMNQYFVDSQQACIEARNEIEELVKQ